MPFAAGLQESLSHRQAQVTRKVFEDTTLEEVLNGHLTTVEAMAQGELITSILLLSEDGRRLSHGAAPNLPAIYREAIDGAEIGARAGSCGTAAFLRHPIYVSDIADDPLWDDYRHLALPHGLRSCWSTPIWGPGKSVLGTFAIYRRTVGGPTNEEIRAIEMITGHVAEAILLSRKSAKQRAVKQQRLSLVVENVHEGFLEQDPLDRLLGLLARLETKAAQLDVVAAGPDTDATADALGIAADQCRELALTIRRYANRLSGRDVPP